MNPGAWQHLRQQPTDPQALGEFAQSVSDLACLSDETIASTTDRDLRETAQMVKAARRVAALHFRARNEATR